MLKTVEYEMNFNPSNENDLGWKWKSYLNEFFSINKRYSNDIKYIILKEFYAPQKINGML